MLIAKSENGWELHTIANGRLSCDNFDLETSDIDWVESRIRQKFGKRLDEEKIMVSWDNWSGIFIMQMPGIDTDSSDALIRKIYKFLACDDSEVSDLKKKKLFIIAIILILMILLTPIRINIKDGGSVSYKSLVYEVTKIHRLAPDANDVKPYIDGLEIKILGITVYRVTNE